jgi:SAM-dependent methyltransferase
MDHPAESTDAQHEVTVVPQPQEDNVQATGPDPNAALEAEDNHDPGDDADSAYSETPESATTSLTSSIKNHTYENGRRYHSYRAGEYILPNDEREQDRLDLMHHIFKLILRGELFAAPLPKNLQHVLDFGTGTGIWAIDFADEFPSAEVLGTDLSPIQPSWVPPNLSFLVDDVESQWAYARTEPFDFIHGRAMSGAIKDWSKLYDQAYKHLKPGGWLEMQEYETWAKSDDGTLENAKYLMEWQEKVDEAATLFGKKMNVAETHKQRLIDAGFVDVRDDVYKVPVGLWPKDPRQKEIGKYELLHMLDAVEPFTLALFTRVLGWSRERAEALMVGVRADFKNPRNHIYSNFHFIYGKKPETV